MGIFSSTPQERQQAHNEGQTDAAKGEIDRTADPITFITEVLFQGIKEENQAYRNGRENVTKDKQ
jgi:hypothetical protein